MKNLIQFLGTILFITPLMLTSQELPDANAIVHQTQIRDDGNFLTQDVRLVLISKNGKSRIQDTKVYRKYYGEERRQAIFYTSPSNISGTGFLVIDYPVKDKDDDQWLYLPALRKTRRISAANRGDYFLGTDLTYEDIKLGPKLSDEDYVHTTSGMEDIDGHPCYIIESTPTDQRTSKELGYSKTKSWIDKDIWIVRKAEFWDIGGNSLKTIFVKDIEKIEGIWTPRQFHIINHKTGHMTDFIFSNIDYTHEIVDEIFTERALIRGI